MLLTNYATKTERTARKNPASDGAWPVAIDYGFSGIKGFAPNKTFCFPNCAVKLEDESQIIDVTDYDVVVKDGTGTWVIGERAHEIISPANAMNYESEMYERNRYFSPFFGALMKAGLGVALSGNELGRYRGEPIVVQTGLPPKYKEQDTELLKEALSGEYSFEMRLGRGPFRRYEFSVGQDDVRVMDQPMGSLVSAITGPDGKPSPADYRLLKSNTLVFDPGFKTLDVYDVSAGTYKGSNTFDTLGMHEVFRRTCDELRKRWGASVAVAGMQNALRKGYVRAFDRRNMASRNVGFDEVLEEKSREVCMEAVQKLLSIYDYLQDHDFLVVTGGTGNAWLPIIEEYFRNMESLTIVSANKNDPSLSNTYSNVRGYYMYLLRLLSRGRK